MCQDSEYMVIQDIKQLPQELSKVYRSLTGWAARNRVTYLEFDYASMPPLCREWSLLLQSYQAPSFSLTLPKRENWREHHVEFFCWKTNAVVFDRKHDAGLSRNFVIEELPCICLYLLCGDLYFITMVYTRWNSSRICPSSGLTREIFSPGLTRLIPRGYRVLGQGGLL